MKDLQDERERKNVGKLMKHGRLEKVVVRSARGITKGIYWWNE